MTFADLAARLSPAVVNVSTKARVQASQSPNLPQGFPFGDLFPDLGGGSVSRNATSLGSGFIVSSDGYIVTNDHVIGGKDKGATVTAITVRLSGGAEYRARVVGHDEAADLAVLKIEAQNLPFVRFGDSTRLRVGDWVLAIGNPYGLGGTVTAGIVSALHRNIQAGPFDRFIQTDAAINVGNSGGPLFDMSGNVIGINSAIVSPTGANVGIGFAVPAEQARAVIETLMHGGQVRRGYIGLVVQPVSEDIASSLGLSPDRGEIVAQIAPGLPAERAGILQGDVILRANGQDVSSDNTLSRIVSGVPIGSRLSIEILRGGERKMVTAVVAERPPESKLIGASEPSDKDDGASPADIRAGSALGLAVKPMTPALGQQLGVAGTTSGLVVVGVDPSSDAASNGIRKGDIILTINQRTVRTAQDFATIIGEARRNRRDHVLLLIRRGSGIPVYVAVALSGRRP
ncbi:MAG: DegQ family serine endoprotease [Sphingomicrobium sp.]